MAAYAHQLGADFGRGHGDWSREAVDRIAPDAMSVRSRWLHWNHDATMVGVFRLNFWRGWQWVNTREAAYQEPTIEQPVT